MLGNFMKVVCVVVCVFELYDMVLAARDDEGPFWLRVISILGDGVIMFAVTQFCWWGTF